MPAAPCLCLCLWTQPGHPSVGRRNEYQRKLGVNRHIAQNSSPVSVVSQCRLVSGWGLVKRRSAPPSGPMWLGKDFTLMNIHVFRSAGDDSRRGRWGVDGKFTWVSITPSRITEHERHGHLPRRSATSRRCRSLHNWRLDTRRQHVLDGTTTRCTGCGRKRTTTKKLQFPVAKFFSGYFLDLSELIPRSSWTSVILYKTDKNWNKKIFASRQPVLRTILTRKCILKIKIADTLSARCSTDKFIHES